MRFFFLIFCLLLPGTVVFAQQNYDVSLIPKELLPYASAVVRNEEISIEVKDIYSSVYHIKKAITVLNKNGDHIAHIFIGHSKSENIKYVKGTIYSDLGKQIRKFSESNFEDVSEQDGFSLFTDEKVKYYIPSVTDYPYTIEYEYESRSKQTLNFRDWNPNPSTGLAVEKSSFTFICTPDFNVRYKEFNLPVSATVGPNPAGLKTYNWQISNLKAVKSEPYSPQEDEYLSSVKIVPEKFTYSGINGSFTNWQELGKWYYDKLLINRQQLLNETVEHIKEITKDIIDPKLKAKKIYEYMQDKTHYISVQIGIGGYQPFLASDVDKLNYGDCKALVNYTQALLKVVNVDSYYCVVEANSNQRVSLLNDFASMSQGNHIILCLPFKNDTTWVDCTSQTLPFGYLSNFTNNRTVLACTPEGGKILHTPKLTAQNNTQIRNANFVIKQDGELSGDMITCFSGEQYDNHDYFIPESATEKIKTLKRIYPINNLEIEDFEFKQDKALKPITTEKVKLTARDYGSINDGKFYFMINPVNRKNKAPNEVRNRHNDVYINDGYTDEDEITYTLPAGYHLSTIPLNKSINKPFGSFSATMTEKGGKLIYKRVLQVVDGTYPKDSYQELVDFYQFVVDADDYTVTLIKNN